MRREPSAMSRSAAAVPGHSERRGVSGAISGPPTFTQTPIVVRRAYEYADGPQNAA